MRWRVCSPDNISKVLAFVSNTINVRFEPNDIVACRELPARNKRASADHLVRAEWRGQTAAVAEWARAWDTLTMFEATVCGRS